MRVRKLGGAIAEVVVRTHPVPMEMVVIHDRFGRSGQQNDLMAAFGIKAPNVAGRGCAGQPDGGLNAMEVAQERRVAGRIGVDDGSTRESDRIRRE